MALIEVNPMKDKMSMASRAVISIKQWIINYLQSERYKPHVSKNKTI